MKTFKRFASRTSLHGFSEIAETKSIFWKFIWSAIVISAFGLTTFQIYRGVEQFLNQPLLTSVTHAINEEIRYPSLTVCSPHWMYWVDWKRAYSMNFTKPMVLYALSFMDNVKTHLSFNITETRTELLLQMVKNNFTRLSEFYKAIARTPPFVRSTIYVNIQAINSTIQFYNLEHRSLFCCYRISSEEVSILNNENKIFSFSLPDLSYGNIYEGVSEEEYNYNMLNILDFYSTNIPTFREPKNLTSLGLPWIIFPAGITTWVEIGSEKHWYEFYISASGFRIRNMTCKNDLKFERESLSEERKKCKAKYLLKTCQCSNITDLVLINEDTFEKTCIKEIVFTGNNGSDLSSHSDKTKEDNCADNENAKREWNQCIRNIPAPCERWQYTFRQTESQLSQGFSSYFEKNHTSVLIFYPESDEILVTTENNVQTWESFIASIGGVLGIWTGASLLSCIQLVYLFCTSEYEK